MKKKRQLKVYSWYPKCYKKITCQQPAVREVHFLHFFNRKYSNWRKTNNEEEKLIEDGHEKKQTKYSCEILI